MFKPKMTLTSQTCLTEMFGPHMKKLAHEDNPDSIKYYVKKYILNNKELFKGKKVLDVPAGSGITSRILNEVGAKVYPYDLFPEFFHESKETCKFCDLTEKIPEKDGFFDIVICQEGIEHLPNACHALGEMNRVLKKNGLLIITTPNYSSLQARLSNLIFESENSKRFMPPNEYESIWFSGKKTSSASRAKYYFGHAFLLGIQKFRLLWKINGFDLMELVKNKVKMRNFFLFVLWYPFLLFGSFYLWQKNTRKLNTEKNARNIVFKEQLKLNLSLTILLHSHLFVVLKKTKTTNEAFQIYKTENIKLFKET
ncbi:MAG: class I SAM-dependent methyltransferase [Spirochaetia bacterium]|nr:class I SAM-dependent methyltransferase [Spirochaetia bacterium]